MKTKKIDRPFGARDKIGYLFGDFGCNMSFQLISSYLMLFMTQGMGISVDHWAIIVLVAKIFDAINDPIIGAMVDARRPGKNGKFRPWLLWGSVAIAITTLLLFIDTRAVSYGGRFAYCLIMYMVWSVAYTAANVPYGSLNAALTDDPGQRASLSSLRSIGAVIAMLPIMVLMPMVVYGEKNENGIETVKPEVFVWVALVCGILCIAGLSITYFLTKERNQVEKPNEKFNYFKTLWGFLKNRAALGMCLASFAQLVLIMTCSTSMALVFQLYFQNKNLIAVGGIITMAPMLLLIPFMGKMSVKFGKKEIATWPNLISIAIMIIMLFIPFERNTTGAVIYAAMFGIAMLAGGTFMLATWSMVADCVDQQEIATGKREEGSVYATYSLARKIAQGVGASFVSLCLGWVGYKAEDVANTTPEVSENILKLSIILPLAGFIVVFLVLLFVYNLNKKKVEENTAILRERHGVCESVEYVVQNVFSDAETEEADVAAPSRKTFAEQALEIVQDKVFETVDDEIEISTSFKTALGEEGLSSTEPMNDDGQQSD